MTKDKNDKEKRKRKKRKKKRKRKKKQPSESEGFRRYLRQDSYYSEQLNESIPEIIRR